MERQPVMKNLKRIGIALMIVPILFLSGCWDRVEIEDRGFVTGVGLDPVENVPPDEQFKLIQQIVVPGGVSTGASGSSGSGSKTKPFENMVSSGETVMENIHNVAANTSRSPFYEHLKVILISQEVAQSMAFENTIDYFIRSPEMRRGIKILITKDPAQDILNLNPPSSDIPGLFINSITENSYKNMQMLQPSRISDINEDLYNKQSFIIQTIFLQGSDLKVEGGAVFKGISNKLIGFLTGQEVAGLKFIRGKASGGVIRPPFNNKHVSFKIERAKSQMSASVKSKRDITMNLTIGTEGAIYEIGTSVNLLSKTVLNQIEKAIGESIKKKVKHTITRLQDDLVADILGVNDYLKVHNWKLWNKIQGDWENGDKLFSKVKFNINVNVSLRNIGTENHTDVEEQYKAGGQK
ncbi:Ger(x)C family spore germination protein [Tuberibacillus sp. Marseille-P3662]|uniref:Ger(x)C family spore germination protein n=1 Tax=Tuberibacillus sp. Marseille-P3662 TaxID=1965358 RepID=UPI000A1CEEEA|nr:Ger(x)C family spore germination protein [Tuberibacillus sp. Marseille-P3662]